MSNNQPKVKILISYHKPAVLLQDDVLTPIHVGRALATEASKDGSMSEEDYQWMLDNMIGDDTGDNISYLNREFCELTAMYWAWKNYDKLGNPEYIGFMHYRRLFDFIGNSKYLNINKDLNMPELKYMEKEDYFNYYNKKNLIQLIEDNKYIISEPHNSNPYEHYKSAKNLHIEDYNKCLEIIDKYYFKYKEASKIYNQGNKSYFCNMFVMPKDDFFEYCDFLFDIIFKLKNIININFYNMQESRVLAYISEWITAIYFIYLVISKSINIQNIPIIYIHNTDIIKELYQNKDDSINVCFSSNDNYVPYLSVAIQSLIKNSNISYYYNIYILETNISKNNKDKISTMSSNNIKIKFININNYTRHINYTDFFVSRHFSIEAYYRIFIPRIFKNFNKILYLDCDIVILEDISKLYKLSFNNKNIISVIKDTEISRSLYNNTVAIRTIDYTLTWLEYLQNILKLENPYDYFQSGVILYDIKKCIRFNLEEKFLSKVKEISNPVNVEQCILNSICQNNVNFIDVSWNVEWMLPIHFSDLEIQLPVETYYNYFKAYNNPKILHYCDNIKPWNFPNYKKAYIWWQYARQTPFYEEIIYQNTNIQRIQNISDARFSIADFLFSVLNKYDLLEICILGIRIKIKKKYLNNDKYSSFVDRIFSIYKNEKYKRITILGIKITTRQDKTRQDKTRQDKTRQDIIRYYVYFLIILYIYNYIKYKYKKDQSYLF